MSFKEEIIKKYNELIKEELKIIQIWKNGSYQFKQKQIEICEKSISFYKSQKKIWHLKTEN